VSDKGGWSSTELQTHGIALDSGRCDIREIFSNENWTLAELRTALQPHMHGGSPVIIRGAVGLLGSGMLQASLTRRALLHTSGTQIVKVAPIPYNEVFSVKGHQMQLRQYVEEHVNNGADGDDIVSSGSNDVGDDSDGGDGDGDGDSGANDGDDDRVPLYMFSRDFLARNQGLARNLDGIFDAIDGIDGVFARTEQMAKEQVQFYLGPPGSGAP
jgi:hypothetical protein